MGVGEGGGAGIYSCVYVYSYYYPRTVKTTVLHKEFCMAPVAQGWLRASLALWARPRSAPADSLLGMAVRLSLRMEAYLPPPVLMCASKEHGQAGSWALHTPLPARIEIL